MKPFYSINKNNIQVGLFEHHTPRFRFKNNIVFHSNNISKQTNSTFKPVSIPDFGEQINIKEESIGLALSILGMSKFKYNAITINQLKDIRRINCDNKNIYCINILIYYKQNLS